MDDTPHQMTDAAGSTPAIEAANAQASAAATAAAAEPTPPRRSIRPRAVPERLRHDPDDASPPARTATTRGNKRCAQEDSDGNEAASASSAVIEAPPAEGSVGDGSSGEHDDASDNPPPKRSFLRPGRMLPMFPAVGVGKTAAATGLPDTLAFAVLEYLPLRSLVLEAARVSAGWHDALIRYAAKRIHRPHAEGVAAQEAAVAAHVTTTAAAAGTSKGRGAKRAAAV